LLYKEGKDTQREEMGEIGEKKRKKKRRLLHRRILVPSEIP
jgi:hypothetical protein